MVEWVGHQRMGHVANLYKIYGSIEPITFVAQENAIFSARPLTQYQDHHYHYRQQQKTTTSAAAAAVTVARAVLSLLLLLAMIMD